MTPQTVARLGWTSDLRANVLSGLVVALALIPEAIGFSVVAGVDPKVGLYASVVIATVIAFTGGRTAMISAATASTAVLMGPLVREHGVQYLFAATILMGLFQIGAGLLRLGSLMRFVSQSVMTGFVNALAILCSWPSCRTGHRPERGERHPGRALRRPRQGRGRCGFAGPLRRAAGRIATGPAAQPRSARTRAR